ncbi:hypothetical protein ACFWIN_11760 [Streptomyces sp. NPDC127049]|uniref:hypothetical protein n=1 Tax=Streptomyces sp. NPDC127049 TaxID=3347118 RepID=UPI00364C1D06
MTPGRCSRGVRAAMFAAVCVLLAATGHILMSGQGVPVGALSLSFAATVAVTWVLAGRERGLLAVTTASVLVQSALHTAFSWSQPASPVSTPMPMPRPAGEAHAEHAHLAHAAMGHADTGHAAMGHGDLSPSAGALSEAAAGHDMTDMSSSLGMVAAHLLAALLSGLWMAYGEQAAFRLLRAASLRLFRPLCPLLAPLAPVVPDRLRFRPARAGDERAPRRLLLAHSLVSRGPPRALAVL